MRLKVKDVPKYPGYKVSGIVRGEQLHEYRFLVFLQKHLKLNVKSLPKRVDKKHGAWLDDTHMFPPVRGYAKMLVPEYGEYPCDICQFARYNSQCRVQSVCMPYLHYMLADFDKMSGKLLVKKNIPVKFKVPHDERKGRRRIEGKPERQRASSGSRNDSSVPLKRSTRKGGARKRKPAGRKRR
jgi:hypothetical protein